MGNTRQTLPPILSPKQEPPLPPTQEFTCDICIEPTSKIFKNADRCSHPFCTDCIIKYIIVKLNDDNVAHIKCPALNCNHTLDPFACASVIGLTLFLRWTDVLCEVAISDQDKCYCPYTNCNELILNECGGDPKQSKCPNCKRWLCFQCKRVWHTGFRCEESGEFDYGDDLAVGRLAVQNGWMRCPRCRYFVELVEGCQAIKCRCGISFCYVCGKQCYEHWCRCIAERTCWLLCFRIFLGLMFVAVAFVIFWFMFNH